MSARGSCSLASAAALMLLCLLAAPGAAQQAEPPPPSAATPTDEPAAPPAAAAPAASLEPPSRETDVGKATAGAAGTHEAGPRIDLPPELASPPQPQPGLQRVEPMVRIGMAPESDETLARGLGPERMEQPQTVVGGYGQFTLNSLRVGPDATNDFSTRASVRRLVLFVAHPITNAIRVYSEFEWENAIACSSCTGSAEVEQAFVDWKLLGDALTLRAGLVLVPMGIVNQWHEPPVFNGVDRPGVDTFVIPTTWRELGLGFTGQLSQTWRYELYVTTTLDPLRLDAQGLGGALGLGSFAKADAFAVTGRVEFEPLLGIITGLSFFASDLGGNGEYFRQNGRKRDLSLPLFGYALDARVRRYGLEARAVWSQFFLPNSGDLLESYREDGSPIFPNVESTGPVPTEIQGGYVELAYNTLYWVKTVQQLLAFVRIEHYDTQAEVPDGYDKLPELDVDELTMGLTYRPLPQLVWKADVQLRDRRYGLDELQINAGFGYMF